MNIDIKAVHFDVKDETREFVQKKLERIEFAKEMIVDLLFTFTREKSDFITEAKLNFRWGIAAHIKVRAYELHEAIDILIDKMELKIKKEKGKIQKHKGASSISQA